MSRDDSEFTAYLAARWPVLVRELVLLGHESGEAHDLALETVVRIHPDRHRLLREEDVDIAIHRELLDVREQHLRRSAPVPTPVPVPSAPHPSLSEQAERLQEVSAALAAMDAGDRVVVVLRQVAELDEDQVADVLEGAVGPAHLLGDGDVRLALEAIPVDPVHPDEVADRAAARRRRLVLRGTVVLAVVVAVLAGGAFVRAQLDNLGDVTRAANPLPVAWYADGVLHLEDVTVGVRPVVDLVTVPDGVVLTDERGDVVLAEADGDLTTLGRTVPGEGLVVEPDNGWVAWADPGRGDPEVVVHDTRVGAEVGRRSLATAGEGGGQPVGESGPVAIDGERIYYRTSRSDFAWEPLTGNAFALAGVLMDWADGALVREVPGSSRLEVQAQPYDTGSQVSGGDPRLTPDGRWLMTTDETDDLVVYDTASGQEVPRMHSPSDQGLTWTYAGPDTFLITVLHKLQDKRYQDTLQMPDEGDYRIYQCVVGREDACVEVHRVPRRSTEPPVLAR